MKSVELNVIEESLKRNDVFRMKLEETIIERHTIGTSGDSAPHVLSSNENH